MVGLGFQRRRRSAAEILSASLVSLFLFFISQSALAMVPRLFPWLSLVAMLPVSAVVLVVTFGLGIISRRTLGVSQSAPAMVVYHILFMWAVYIAMIRDGFIAGLVFPFCACGAREELFCTKSAVPSLLDAIINGECALLLFGLYRILSGDPGIVAYDSSSSEVHECSLPEGSIHYENSSPISRVRYCKICKTSVKGFDHHCSAFGNCIGQKNQRLFMMLLVGFIISEATYTMSSTQYIAKSVRTHKLGFKNDLPGNLVISTLLFAVLQLLWQLCNLNSPVYCFGSPTGISVPQDSRKNIATQILRT